jgi:GR25 family glycosyltransferase involved in LPS biosynthesis
MKAELERIGIDFEFISAVDGRTLDLGDSSLIDPSVAAGCVYPGTYACPLSHFQTYQKILEDGRDRALVLEDDVKLPTDLNDLVDDVAEHLTGAEVALLNYTAHPPGPLRISREGSVDLLSSRVLALPIDIRQLLNAGAYVITREACALMVEHLLPIRTTADDWPFFYEQGFLDRVRCVLPQPAPKNLNFESTIGFYTAALFGNGTKARMGRFLVRSRIPIVHQGIRYRRQRIERRMSKTEIVDLPFIEKPSRLGSP